MKEESGKRKMSGAWLCLMAFFIFHFSIFLWRSTAT